MKLSTLKRFFGVMSMTILAGIIKNLRKDRMIRDCFPRFSHPLIRL